jgi:hypothetical protein
VAKDIIVSPPSALRREQKGRFAVIRDERSPHSSDTCSPLTYDASESDISQSTETKSDIQNPPVKKKHSVTFAQRECDIREFVPDSGEFENGSPPQIDKFTEEYLGLQEQLKKMKEVCDNLKQTNLRNDLEDLQFTMRKFENSSVAHNVGHLRERYKLISEMMASMSMHNFSRVFQSHLSFHRTNFSKIPHKDFSLKTEKILHLIQH